MNKVLVFYAGMLYGEYEYYPSSWYLPDGAYVHYPDETKAWDHCKLGSFSRIPKEDVPKELLLLTLLLT